MAIKIEQIEAFGKAIQDYRTSHNYGWTSPTAARALVAAVQPFLGTNQFDAHKAFDFVLHGTILEIESLLTKEPPISALRNNLNAALDELYVRLANRLAGITPRLAEPELPDTEAAPVLESGPELTDVRREVA